MASFCTRGSDFYIKGAAKKLTLRKFFTKVPPKSEPFGFFSSKGAAKTLRGRNPAILRGGADKKWNDPVGSSYNTPGIS